MSLEAEDLRRGLERNSPDDPIVGVDDGPVDDTDEDTSKGPRATEDLYIPRPDLGPGASTFVRSGDLIPTNLVALLEAQAKPARRRRPKP